LHASPALSPAQPVREANPGFAVFSDDVQLGPSRGAMCGASQGKLAGPLTREFNQEILPRWRGGAFATGSRALHMAR
jgi:hypothetical protein